MLSSQGAIRQAAREKVPAGEMGRFSWSARRAGLSGPMCAYRVLAGGPAGRRVPAVATGVARSLVLKPSRHAVTELPLT